MHSFTPTMRFPTQILLLFFLCSLMLSAQLSAAFVSPLCSLTRATSQSRVTTCCRGKKNFVDEILDGLDTMAGVSPLSEADLKDDSIDLVQRAQERKDMAPPSDALQKPSVVVFFALLGIIPSLLFIAAIKSGVRPLGL